MAKGQGKKKDKAGSAALSVKGKVDKKSLRASASLNVEGSFCRYYYGKLKRSFKCIKEAKDELGIGQCIRGHCCRAVKKVGGTTFLRCKLQGSCPPLRFFFGI